MIKDFEGRVALVTGASRGIGYQIAKQLGERGAHVIALARTVGGLEDLDDEIRSAGGETTLVPLDLTDFDALDRLGAAIYERWKKLDIFVANAGMLGVLSPIGHISPKDFEKVTAVNVVANWRLIRSLDPLLRQSDAGPCTVPVFRSCKHLHTFLGSSVHQQGFRGSHGADLGE